MCPTDQPTPTTQPRPRRHLRLYRYEPQPRARPGHGASQPRNGRTPAHRPPTIQPPTTCPSAAHLPANQPPALPPAPRLAPAEVPPRAVHALRLPLQPARGEQAARGLHGVMARCRLQVCPGALPQRRIAPKGAEGSAAPPPVRPARRCTRWKPVSLGAGGVEACFMPSAMVARAAAAGMLAHACMHACMHAAVVARCCPLLGLRTQTAGRAGGGAAWRARGRPGQTHPPCALLIARVTSHLRLVHAASPCAHTLHPAPRCRPTRAALHGSSGRLVRSWRCWALAAPIHVFVKPRQMDGG
jgi:hypothetical protein